MFLLNLKPQILKCLYLICVKDFKFGNTNIMKISFKQKWFPVIINTLGAAASLLFYSVTHATNFNSLIVIQIVVGSIIPLVLIVLTDLFKIKFPMIFNLAIVFQIGLSIYLGNGFSFYVLIPFYDKILHTYFGFICSLIIFCLLLYYNGEQVPTPLLLFVVFFSTLGIGGIWEIFEYICDYFTGGDSLGINKSIEKNLHPCTDIMIDLVVTMVGTLLFYFVLLIDKFNNFSLTHWISQKIDQERTS